MNFIEGTRKNYHQRLDIERKVQHRCYEYFGFFNNAASIRKAHHNLTYALRQCGIIHTPPDIKDVVRAITPYLRTWYWASVKEQVAKYKANFKPSKPLPLP